MQVKITGLDELHELFEKLYDEDNYEEIILTLALNTLVKAMEFAPEDTGLMEESIELRRVNEDWELFIDGRKVPYAAYNEYGTYKMPVGNEKQPLSVTSTSGKSCYRPFIRPAIYECLNNMDKIINDFWNKMK